MTKRIQRAMWIAAALSIAMVSTVDAGGNRSAKIDRDQDGTVSADELAKTFERGKGIRDLVFTRMDTDGDGRVSRAEFKSDKTFKQADTSRDGYLTREEFHAWRAREVAAGAQGLDRDGDKAISAQELGTAWDKGKAEREQRQAEWKHAWESRDKVDANQDGKLTSAEAAARYNRGQQDRVALFRQLDADHNKTLSRKEFPVPDAFAKVDANHDNRVSQQEFLAAHAVVTASIFESLDANRDQTITPDEIKRALQKNQ